MRTLLYREPRLLALVLFVIIGLGASALTTIGRQEDPTITNLFATIITPYPGASPARVEALVTEKIEQELREIPEIDEIASTSRSGISSVRVELSQFITEEQIEQSWSEIRDALSDAARNFPAGVPEPTFDDDRTGAYTLIASIQAREGLSVPTSVLGRYAERLQDILRNAPGTELVRLFGEPEEEVLVEIDRARLASLGLSPDDVSAAISRADAKVRAGQVRGVSGDYLIEVLGEIETLDRIRAVPISVGEGDPIARVGDIATVRRGVRQPEETRAFADGARAVVVAARMEPDLQVDTWTKVVERRVEAFRAELPTGLEYKVLFDQSGYTAERLGDLAINLLIGVGLVVAVLLITLGWRSAMIVAAMLPMSGLLSLAVLQQTGIPIQQMSVTGLIVALGLLVDAAIVMTDEVRHRLESGKTPLEAVSGSVGRLTVPLLSSTVTTVLAFMPMALLPGPAGDFVGSIAISVIVMLTSSFLLAITVTAALSGYILPGSLSRRERGGALSWLSSGIRGGALGRVFSASLDLSLRHRRLSVLAAIAVPLIGFAAFPTLTAQFFPGVERDQFYVQVKLPDGAAIAETQRMADAADLILREEADIAAVHWFVGESAPAFYYNMVTDRDGVSSFAEALVTTISEEATNRVIPALQVRFDAELPGAQILVRDLVQGPPVDAPLEMRLVGPSTERLRQLGVEARNVMARIPDVIHTRADLMGGEPKLEFDLDEEKVRLAGLTLGEVARQLEALLEGATGGSMVEATEELPVRVRVGGSDRSLPERIGSLYIVPPNAEASAGYPGIPLSALGTIRLSPSESPIARRNGERVNTVQAFLRFGVLPEEALKQLQAELTENPLALPPGYRIEWGGDSDARAETVRNLMSSIGMIVLAMLATIVMTFNSFRLSLIALAVSVLSMGLSLFALEVFQYPFGIQALIGVIGSIGVSINAAIIIMTALQEDERASAGDRSAIRDVVLRSSRHIVSTTVTTFGGFLPLILGGGSFWPPFAMSIAGGVLLSTIVSFYFVPQMFSLSVGRRPIRRIPADRAVERLAAPKLALPQAAEYRAAE